MNEAKHFMMAMKEAYPHLYENLVDLLKLKNQKQIKNFLIKHNKEVDAVKFSMLMFVFLKGKYNENY